MAGRCTRLDVPMPSGRRAHQPASPTTSDPGTAVRANVASHPPWDPLAADARAGKDNKPCLGSDKKILTTRAGCAVRAPAFGAAANAGTGNGQFPQPCPTSKMDSRSWTCRRSALE